MSIFINYFLYILKYLLPFFMVLELLSIVKGGENIKKSLFALVVLFLIIAGASAVDASGDLSVIGEEAEEPDIPDLYVEEDFNITSENIDKYFPNGVLASNYSDSSLNFKGTFENLGVLRIAQKNVTFNGEESLFINTVLRISYFNPCR